MILGFSGNITPNTDASSRLNIDTSIILKAIEKRLPEITKAAQQKVMDAIISGQKSVTLEGVSHKLQRIKNDIAKEFKNIRIEVPIYLKPQIGSPKAQETPQAAQETPQAAQQFAQGIPTMITRGMKSSLGGLGYTSEDIRNMKPEEAVRIISENRKKLATLTGEEVKAQQKVTDAVNKEVPTTERMQFPDKEQFEAESHKLDENQRKFAQDEQDDIQKEIEAKEKLRQQRQAAREKLRIQQQVTESKLKLSTIHTKYSSAFTTLGEIDPSFADPNVSRYKIRETPSGWSQIKASYTTDTGIVKEASVSVDKFGRTLVDTQRRFRSFIDSVIRDTKEFMKWSIAIGLVYTPLQKLKELVDAAITNQALLADTLITLGKSQEYVNRVFEDAADIATLTGESLTGVIEGYNLAFRATGSITNETEKLATANKLLTDSLILAKTANMSQADATDTLVASLKQMGMKLTEGDVLLDKWIATSRSANVDLNTLATSFAIVAEAASNVGLSVDELNGLIATVAEVGITSAKETGNATRALISGYTTDSAVKELERFGIAVEDSDNRVREFSTVFGEIKSKFEKQLISADQLNQIAYAIGGGNRRMAQVVSAIVNLDKMNQVAAKSANAHAEAERALQLELDTVQARSTILGNSFQELAQAMGTNGGILDSLSFLITLLTQVTTLLAGVTKVVGVAGPALGALGITRLLMGTNAAGQVGNMAGGLGYAAGFLTSNVKSIATGRTNFPSTSKVEYDAGQQEAVMRTVRGTRLSLAKDEGKTMAASFNVTAQRYAPQIGMGIATIMMASMAAAKDDWTGAGLIVAGSIAGGVLGSLIPGGTAIGMAIGSTAGSVIAEAMGKEWEIIRKGPAYAKPGEQTTEEEKKGELTAEDAEALLKRAAGGDVGRWILGAYFDVLKTVTKPFGTKVEESLGQNPAVQRTSAAIEIMDVVRGVFGVQTKAQKNMGLSNEDLWNIYYQGLENAGEGVAGITLPSENVVQLDTAEAERQVDRLSDYMRTELYKPGTGISSKEYKDATDVISGLKSTLSSLLLPLELSNGELGDLGNLVKSDADAYEILSNIMVKGTQEQRTTIAELAGTIADLYNKMKEAEITGTYTYTNQLGEKVSVTREELQKQLNEKLAQYPAIVAKINAEIQINWESIPETVDATALSLNDVNAALELARQYAEDYYAQLTEGEKLAQQTIDGSVEKLINYEDGWKRVTGEQAAYYQEGLDLAEKLGKVSTKKLQLQEFDIPSTQLAEVLAKADELAARVEPLGVDVTKEPIVAQFNDDQIIKFDGNMNLIRMVLEEILDVNTKELEGIYNLPANGTFFVPWQAAVMRPTATTGVTRTGTTGPTGVTETGTTWDWHEKYPITTTAKITPRVYPKDWTKEITTEDLLKKAKGTVTGVTKGSETFLDKFLDFMRKGWGLDSDLLSGKAGMSKLETPTYTQNALTDLANIQKAPAELTLNLKLNSAVQLLLDGRTVSNVVKTYIQSDLLKFSATNSLVNKSVVA